MSKITKLDDIEIYRVSLELARDIFGLTKHEKLIHEFSLQDQIKRSSISVSANIAEGYGRNTKKDFSQFLSIALGSVNETIAFLDFLKLAFLIPTDSLKEQYFTLSRRIHSFRSYLLKNL